MITQVTRIKHYHHMLVPLDGSKLAEVVLGYAGDIASRLGVEVTLLHVYPPEEKALSALHQGYINWAAYSLGCGLGDHNINVTGKVAEGYPAEEILRYAEQNQVDLILMATHGRSGLSRWIIGSVSEKVFRASNVPVWLVRGDPNFQAYQEGITNTIVVTLDGSKLAEQALPYSEALAEQWGPERIGITLLSVCETPTIPSDYPPDMPLTWERHVEQEIKICQQKTAAYLQSIAEKLSAKGIEVTTEILMGGAARAISNYVNERPPRLLVMATHGRSGLGRILIGSVAESVMGSVSVPVFLVKPQPEIS